MEALLFQESVVVVLEQPLVLPHLVILGGGRPALAVDFVEQVAAVDGVGVHLQVVQ